MNDVNKQLLDAAKEMLIDIRLSQNNMRHAAQRDAMWQGCAEAIQPRVDALQQTIAAAEQAEPVVKDILMAFGVDVLVKSGSSMRESDLAAIVDRYVGAEIGEWVHCSPELLSSGIDCATTPRRDCQCEHGGSHDHFVLKQKGKT